MKKTVRTFVLDPGSLNRVLFVRLRSIGDTVLLTPTISAFKRWSPRSHLSVLVESHVEEVLRHNPHVDQVLVRRKSNRADLRLLAKEFLGGKYDLAVDFHGGNRAAFFTLASRAETRVGFSTYRHRWAYNTHVPIGSRGRSDSTPLHTVDLQMMLLLGLGMESSGDRESDEKLVLVVGAAERDRVSDLRAQKDLHDPLVVIHPAASLRSKTWSSQKFGAVARRAKELGASVALIGKQTDREVLEAVAQAGGCKTQSIFDDLGLAEISALLENCAVFAGNDAGPMHMAAALGRKVIVVFGSSNPHRWRPWGTEYTLVRSGPACSPCPGKICEEHRPFHCIDELSEEPVLAALQHYLISGYDQELIDKRSERNGRQA